MTLEQLEARDVPAIVQTGLPSFLATGPAPAVDVGFLTGIAGPQNPFVAEGAPSETVNPTTGAASALATVPGFPNVLFAAGSGGGVWRTVNATDAQPTWQPLTDGLPSLSITSLDIDPANPNRLIAGIGRNPTVLNGTQGDFLGVYVTDDALAANPSFRVASVDPTRSPFQDVRAVLARGAYSAFGGTGSPDRADYLVAASNFGLSRSLGGGAFEVITGVGGLPNDLGIGYSLAADPSAPGRVYALTDAGLFRTDDISAPVANWVNITRAFMLINQNAPNPTVNGKLSIHSTPGNTVLYVAVANETSRFTTANGVTLVGSELVSLSFSTTSGNTFVSMDVPENAEPFVRQVVGASNATPITITTAGPHQLLTGARVRVSGVQGNLGANALFSITVVDAVSFQLNGSVGTGAFSGGGTVEELTGVNLFGGALAGFALRADPIDPNVVYVGGDASTSSGAFGAAIQRGDRSRPRGGGNLVPSPQFTQVTGVNAAGTAPAIGVSDLAVDAFGRLVAATDGGVYARGTGRDNTSPWTSTNGNLSFSQMLSIGYDPINNALFGGTVDTGTVSQFSGSGPVGSNIWSAQPGSSDFAEAETTTVPGSTVRYTSGLRLSGTRRQVYDAANKLITTSRVGFTNAATGQFALVGADADNSDDPTGGAFFKVNAVDPRLVLAGRNSLYEDDNPEGFAGDTISNVTPAGLTGRLTAVVYGGRLAGVDIPRAAYVGTQGGQLFARGQRDGFEARPLPGTGAVTAVAVDPDDFRRVYAVRAESAVYASTDGGFTWANITQNLFAQTLDARGNPVLFEIDPATGQPRGGLTTAIRDITVYDPTPGGSSGGDVTLIAAGRGGVFRFNPGTGINPVPGFGWTEFGVGLPNASVSQVRVVGSRLFVATLGRGAYAIPDISGAINAVATVSVVGTAGNDTITITGDPANPDNVVVSDGLGNTLTVGRSASPTVRLLGGAGADTIQILATGSAGGDLGFLKIPVFADAGGDAGDRLVIRNAGRTTPTVVTVNALSVGAVGPDDLFGDFPGAGLTYAGLGLGTLELDLGVDAPGGSRINLQSTGAATTRLLGSAGTDTFTLSSFAGFTAGDAAVASASGVTESLAFINGTVELDGRGGGDAVTLNDVAATSGNANVVVAGNRVSGLIGSGDSGVVTLAGIASLTLFGSNFGNVAESFAIDNPVVPVRLDTFDGPDTVSVRATAQPLTIDTGAGNDTVNVRAMAANVDLTTGVGDDTIRVGSLAASTDDGNLSGITGRLGVNAGTGANRLIVSDFASKVGRDYTITDNTVLGATAQPISFAAPGGQFVAPGGSGILVRGGQGDDEFNVTRFNAAGQLVVQGNGGNDVFTIDNQTALGTIRLEGGAGADALAFDPGTSKNLAAAVSFDGGGGGDGLRFLGRGDDEDESASITLTGRNSGFYSGLGAPFPFSNVAFADYDGRGGRNAFTIFDASGLSRSVVFRPQNLTDGRFDFDGGFRIQVSNVNAGLTYAGTANGSGGLDELTYQGFDDLNAGPNPTNQGGDDLFVTDAQITNFNDSLGEIVPLNIAREDGAPTLSRLIVLGGTELGGGDRVGARPSDDIPITIDGQGPNRSPGDRLTVLPGGGALISSVGFENRPTSRVITAVGADAGGGPRVRVFDSTSGDLLFDGFVYDPNFRGGVRVAVGDVTGDGVPDLVTAAGFGGGPHIRVFDGVTFALVSEFFAYESNFRGGAFVAIGDLAGTGVNQIITGAGNGGGPLVKIFNANGSQVRAFFAYAEIFRGGVRVASGDVNGDGFDDIVTGAGVGGGPHVRVFNPGDGRVLTEYLAYDPNYRGGIFVAAGDVDGDGFADIITGPGDNTLPFLTFRSSLDGGSVIQVVPFAAIDNAPPLPVPPEVAAFNVELGGIRVAVTANTDGSNSRVVAARGPGFPPRLVNYFTDRGSVDAGLAFEPEFVGGLYVG